MPKVDVAKVTIEVEGITKDVIATPKVFKSGRSGYFAQIPKFVTEDGKIYNGQIQLWGELEQ